MIESLKLLFDPAYQGDVLATITKRVLPTLLGVGICIVGVAFILTGSKTGQTVVGVAKTAAELVATKGASIAK